MNWPVKHGRFGTPLYDVWRSMLARCRNKNARGYSLYGGRGIVVCERWTEFSNFLADMGERPAGASLDRINNDGPYSPDNCRWASAREQQRNKRTNRLLTAFGKTQCLADWAEELDMDPTSIAGRLRKGWSVEDALSKPRGSQVKRSLGKRSQTPASST